jgi:hypothetical protein
MIYLAAPYSHYDKDIVQSRMEKIYAVLAHYMRKGEHILTPLAMHEVVTRHEDIPDDFNYWGDYCLDVLKRCDRMIVLMLPGWDSSRGVAQEIDFCFKNDIPVIYLSEEAWKQNIITSHISLSSQSSTTTT